MRHVLLEKDGLVLCCDAVQVSEVKTVSDTQITRRLV